jgi:hypothetical protein
MWSNIFSVVRIVLLGVWVGAMIGFAFLFAPIAFKHVGPTPAFAATIGASVRAIGNMGFVLGAVAVVITLALRLDGARTKVAILACIAAAFVGTATESWTIVPRMETTPLMTAAYESLHHQSSGVYSIVLLFALAAFVLSSRSRYTLS